MSVPIETEWYFGVLCARCGKPILFARDPSQGVMKFAGEGGIELQCPVLDCHHRKRYHTVQVWHFRVERHKTQETKYRPSRSK